MIKRPENEKPVQLSLRRVRVSPRFSGICYAPASCRSNRRSREVTAGRGDCQTGPLVDKPSHRDVYPRLVGFGLVGALLPFGVAVLLHCGEILGGHVAGD